ncbi:MAG: NAD-dependent epimerase/dehydratase family protein [Verrucomicrobia bacterium]|nr:NAD-dependent epimerase/dehydratase family protein [Verrucomicrobiota bacterium]MBV8482358.1 NAD-dependent epimerase/dehydratase family protein [Verrucomicrobiota bacterium]
MRVLIIGGTRFIGWHIASGLIRAGHSVCVFHRGSTRLEGLDGVSEILGEKENLSSYRDRFRDLHPGVVIDCIGYTETDGRKLIETFAGWIPRLIFLSSCDVYRAHAVLHRATDDPVQATPLTEDSPLRTNVYPYRKYASGPEDWRYDYDKIPVERMLLAQSGLDTTVFRLPAVHGPRDYQLRVWEHLRKMEAGRKVILLSETFSKWLWGRGYVGNIAAAICHFLSKETVSSAVFNLSDPVALSQKEWVEQIAAIAGWTGEILIVPDEFLPDPLRGPYNFAQNWTIDASRFRTATGFTEAFTLEQSITKTIASNRANPPTVSVEQAERWREDDEAEERWLAGR